MRKAVLAIALTLLLTLGTPPAFFSNTSPGSSPYTSYAPTATDFIYPVGNPRAAPTYDKGNANGFYISQMFDNSCDPSLGQGFFYAGQYFCGHSGVDLSDMREGDPVHAVANGLVVYAGYNSSYGEMVRIQHLLPDGSYVYSQYEHMIAGSVLVGADQVVTMGQVIGRVGSTGFVTGPHLHFEMKSVNEDGPGYSFGNTALLVGYYDPIAYVSMHALSQAPTATATTEPTDSPTPAEATATTEPATATTEPATTPDTSTSASATVTAPFTTDMPLQPSPVATAVPPTTTTAPVSGTGVVSTTTDNVTGEAQNILSSFNTRFKSYVSVTADQVNIRSGSGFENAPLNSVQKGARLGYLGMTGDGWVHVALPGNITGYIARQFVEGGPLPTLPPAVTWPTNRPPFVTVLDARYPARNGPLMRDMAIEPLWVGEKLTYLERESSSPSWDKVVLPSGRIGYILNWYLKGPWGGGSSANVGGGSHTEKVKAGKTIAAKPARAVKGPFVVTTVDKLNLRKGPRLSAAPITSLAIGTKLHLRGYHVSWAAVTAPDGTKGYVFGQYVSRLGAHTQRRTTATTREGRSSGIKPHVAPTATPLPPTATPTPRPSISATPSASSSANASRATVKYVVVTVPAANVHVAPDVKATVLISAEKGERLTVRGTRGDWTLITTSKGVTGWIMSNLTR